MKYRKDPRLEVSITPSAYSNNIYGEKVRTTATPASDSTRRIMCMEVLNNPSKYPQADLRQIRKAAIINGWITK